ncbi:NAD(P)/FAD-dependent oxidoreductase [Synechococcus sp. MIT S9503]|uniref:NAD(P)/FAD-dependent oxidoreductase n=1 Tax=Synechococcus sp. MIT S9503 TaxID=3082547 RepID=UPI0039A5251B
MAPIIAVVGGGPMGLAVAYQLALEGAKPVLLEADDRLGGMAASFQFAGQTLERYYHFHCLSDHAFFALLEELGLADQLRWKQTSMGFFMDGRLYPWGSAGSVLSFRRLPMLTRLRYLLHAARCLSLRNWQHLDGMRATDWLKTWLGVKGYALLWQKLFAYKFYEHSDSLSAAWIWSRIRRLGQSRRWLKETLGYLEGGSQRWIDALEQRLRELGCEIQLSSPVEAIRSEGPGQGVVVRTPTGEHHFDAVISTVPLPLVAPMLQAGGADPALVQRYANQVSVACACVVLQTRQPITGNFWTNINDERFGIPGIIEFSNLRPLEGHITYVPYYMPASHPDYQRPDDAFIADSIACLQAINSDLSESDVLAAHGSRYRYAQPVCGTRFQKSLPPLHPLPGITTVDTTVYYPEDRGISESVGYGRELAKKVIRELRTRRQ